MRKRIKTWYFDCGYKQDFEPTEENNTKYFDKLLKKNQCPSCFSGKLKQETIDENKIETITK